jgi:hypothetical protein
VDLVPLVLQVFKDYLELQVLRVCLDQLVEQVRLVMLEPRELLALKVQLELQVSLDSKVSRVLQEVQALKVPQDLLEPLV